MLPIRGCDSVTHCADIMSRYSCLIIIIIIIIITRCRTAETRRQKKRVRKLKERQRDVEVKEYMGYTYGIQSAKGPFWVGKGTERRSGTTHRCNIVGGSTGRHVSCTRLLKFFLSIPHL